MKVRSLGDITGVSGTCNTSAGISSTTAVYVICDPQKHPGHFTVDQIGTSELPGFKIVYTGTAIQGAGYFFLASAGDMNGDGIKDILVSDNLATTDVANKPGSGMVFAIAGGSWIATLMTNAMNNNTIPTIDLNNSAGTLPIVQLPGVGEYNFIGQSIANGKDFDGDGYSDIAFAAPGYGYDPTYNAGPGAVYLIYGSHDFFLQKSLDLSQIGTQFKGALITRSPSTPISLASGLGSGYPGIDQIGFIGDITGDGLPELLIGDPTAQNTIPNTENTYVVFGTAALNGTYYVEDIGQTFDGATYFTDYSGPNSGCTTAGGYCYYAFGSVVDGRDGSVMISAPLAFISGTAAAGTVFISEQPVSNGETIDIRTALKNLQASSLWDYSSQMDRMGYTIKDGKDFRLIGIPAFNNNEGKLLFVPGSQLPAGNINVSTVTLFTITGDSVNDLFTSSLDRSNDAILVGASSNGTNPGKFYFIPTGNVLFQ